MSCEIQLFATFENVQKFLRRGDLNDSENEAEESKNPFAEYEIGISPMGDIIVFAKSSWLLICGSKWDSSSPEGPKVKYSPNWHGHLQCAQGEKVTSLLCLPFFSYGQTVHGSDWTCIVVGFSSGCVRFYTEGMQELISSTLHPEPVIGIKSFCPSLVQQRKTLKQDNNDIYVLYETAICIFNGPNLSQTLFSRRSQLAKSYITSHSNDSSTHGPLDFKKYNFAGQDLITDACYLGQTFRSSHTTFDHLVTVSYAGGFNSNYRTNCPQTSLIVTSGRKPFVGFHYTLESGSSPVLADVALAVANKIRTSVTANLTDWFGFGTKKPASQEKPKEAANDQGERLNCRFGLCDYRRQGQSIISSPDGVYSAVSDSLGRVSLIENSTGIALKLWKGFREAQCGFLLVEEDAAGVRHRKKAGESKASGRVALFIVIYAPKKGLVEIFCTHNGHRISSFKVTKYGRLLYNPRGCIIPASVSGFNLSLGQVVFISDEGLTEFLVPFHCALAEDSSKMSRDLHVLKKMKILLKTDEKSPNFVEEIEKYSRELKTNEVRYQAIELLANNRNTTLEVFKIVLASFLENLRKSEGTDSISKRIAAYAEVIHNLLNFYEFLTDLNNHTADPEPSSSSLNSASIFEEMRTTEKELDLVLKFIDQINEIEGFKKSAIKVSFEEKKTSQMGKYLSCFDFETFLNGLENQEKITNQTKQPCRLGLKSNAKEENLTSLQQLLFRGVLLGSGSRLNEWSTRAESCCLEPADLAVSLLSYWCSGDGSDVLTPKEITNFVEVLKVICSLNDPNVVYIEYNTESPWWTRLRYQIASGPSTVRGLFAALCCRSVTIYVEQEQEFAGKKGHKRHKSNDGTSIHTEWETLSKDTCQWDIFITQLQDVALLNAVLNLELKTRQTSDGLPVLPFDFECQCLSSIQQKGAGRVSELVAKWLTQFGFDPHVFLNKTDIEFHGNEEKTIETDPSLLVENLDKANVAREKTENFTIGLDYLTLLKSRFPYSLTASSLLSNLCWEYTAYWFKNVKDLKYLEAAVRCLKIVPANKIKYGISFLSWNAYLQEKVKSLAVMINRVGKVPKDKLCIQEIGLGSDQVPEFLKLVSEYLTIILDFEEGEKNLDFSINREGIWQNCAGISSSSLVSVALTQPEVNKDLVVLLLQVTTTLLLMSSLNLKVPKLLSTLWDNLDSSIFTLAKNCPKERHNSVIRASRLQWLQKVIAGAVQAIQLVECVPKPASDEVNDTQTAPSAKFKVDEYKKFLQITFDLASVWEVPLDDLRRHQVCELYANGFDRLAEEVIPSVNEKEMLASQILVFAGKRLRHLIEDLKNPCHQMSNLSVNLSEWLKSLDMKNFKYQNETVDDIEVMARYVANWLSEEHPDRKLVIDIIEFLSVFKGSN